jgi:hypothetical protein
MDRNKVEMRRLGDEGRLQRRDLIPQLDEDRKHHHGGFISETRRKVRSKVECSADGAAA